MKRPCKCQRIENYWSATKDSTGKAYTRKDLLFVLGIGAIPILGQFMFILVSIMGFLSAREGEE